jgi:indole-3-glycerol phosphate synthase
VLIGINNRDLRTFTVDLRTTRNLLAAYRDRLGDLPVVSESGIHTFARSAAVASLGGARRAGGGSPVTQPDPGQGVRSLLSP